MRNIIRNTFNNLTRRINLVFLNSAFSNRYPSQGEIDIKKEENLFILEIDMDIEWKNFSRLFCLNIHNQEQKEECKQFLKNILQSNKLTKKIFFLGDKTIYNRIIIDLFYGIIHNQLETDNIHNNLKNNQDTIIRLFYELTKDEINKLSKKELENLNITYFLSKYQEIANDFNTYYIKHNTTRNPKYYINRYLKRKTKTATIVNEFQFCIQDCNDALITMNPKELFSRCSSVSSVEISNSYHRYRNQHPLESNISRSIN